MAGKALVNNECFKFRNMIIFLRENILAKLEVCRKDIVN